MITAAHSNVDYEMLQANAKAIFDTKNVMKNIVEIGITIINNTEKIPFKQFLVYKIVLNHKITLRWQLCDIKKLY